MTLQFGGTFRGRAARTAACAWLIAGAFTPIASAQAQRSVADGVYTAGQARRGQATVATRCVGCHGPKLDGGQAPPLAGDSFLAGVAGSPLRDSFTKIRNTMPADAPGQLTAEQATEIVAYLIEVNAFPAGQVALDADGAALGSIAWPARGAPEARPPANMAQLMRGIFFPNSNIVFNAQTHDPGAPRPASGAEPAAGGFSWTDWGAGIYGGWELVDNAALAIADASPLMLVPGRRCENGRPAPVGEPDWIRFSAEMLQVARETYKASQTRSQDAIIEATGALADACSNCHRAYRDSRGGTPGDPSNKAGRCAPRLRAR